MPKKPALPRDIYVPSALGSAGFIAYAYAMLIGSLAAIWMVYTSSLHPLAKLAIIVPLYLPAGQGLQLLAWIGHEGFHYNLLPNKYASALLGVIASSPIALFSTVGENSIHWNHHKHTNHPGDPQVDLLPPYKGFFTRLLLARPKMELIYLQNVVKLAFRRLDVTMAFEPEATQVFAWINLALTGAWTAAYVLVTVVNWELGVLCVVLPHLVAFLISSLRPYEEHAGTGPDVVHSARTRRSPLLTALYFFNNYHLEHHLYPQVPCWKLPRVHRLLHEKGYYGATQPHITYTLRDALRCTTSRYPYPTARAAGAAAATAESA